MRIKYESELYHFGIPGMKWYKRRFQNEDGSYTALGKLRYGIGQKGRETGKMMSDWSRRMTSKEAANASKMHATPSGKSYFDNAHMLYNGNVRKTARSLMDEYAQASRKNGQPIARASQPAQQYAKDRMRTMARSIGGNDEARVVAARSQYPGEKMRNWDDRLSQYMWNYTTKNPEQGDKAREKAFTPVMSKNDNAKLYLQGAKNLAGNYGRYAKEGAKTAGRLAAKAGVATVRSLAENNTPLWLAANAANPYFHRRMLRNVLGPSKYDDDEPGWRQTADDYKRTGQDIKNFANRTLESAQQRAMSDDWARPDRRSQAEAAADAASDKFRKDAMAGAKNIAGKYMDKAKEGLTGAAASALAAKNGLQYRAQEAAGNARKGAGAFGEIMKAYGKEIGGNANSALARAQFNARNAGDNVQNALRRGAATLGVSAGMNANAAGQRLWDAIRQRATGDPGEDMYKPDPTARSGYDRRVSNAIQASRAINTEAARQAENNRPAGHNVTGTFGGARSTTGKSVADYQKEMLERARSSTPIINNKTPYVLQFGNDRYVPQLTQEGLQLTRTRGKTSASNYDYDIRDKQAAAAARDRHAVGTSITIPGSEAARSTSSASATPSTSSRVERSEYMDRIKAIQDANKYRADLAAASSGRRAPAELMFDQAVRSVQNYGKGPTTPGSNDAIRRSFNSYRNEHPNTDMSLEDYKRKYGWMYGVGN